MEKGTREMNANELADVLDKTGWDKRFTEWDLLDEAATMLRQQQAVIENMKDREEFLITTIKALISKAQEK